MALPGIGRSTAAAIMVFGFGERHAILDGNVKRVLARVVRIEGYPGSKDGRRRALGASRAPASPTRRRSVHAGPDGPRRDGLHAFQAALRRLPRQRRCLAFAQGRVAELPQPRPRKALPHKRCGMMIIEHEGALLLEKRPAPGIWGGLWCFPQIDLEEDVGAVCAHRFGVHVAAPEMLPTIDHGFTHFRLTISPMRMRATSVTPRAGEADQSLDRTSTSRMRRCPRR